tara:strand:- start:2334 stop:2717 length:384 start_codon:yes stop_codon:yes gene_type:complete
MTSSTEEVTERLLEELGKVKSNEEIKEYLVREISRTERRMSARLSRMRERLESVERLANEKGWVTFTMHEFMLDQAARQNDDDEGKIEDGYIYLCNLRELMEIIEGKENTKVEASGQWWSMVSTKHF